MRYLKNKGRFKMPLMQQVVGRWIASLKLQPMHFVYLHGMPMSLNSLAVKDVALLYVVYCYPNLICYYSMNQLTILTRKVLLGLNISYMTSLAPWWLLHMIVISWIMWLVGF